MRSFGDYALAKRSNLSKEMTFTKAKLELESPKKKPIRYTSQSEEEFMAIISANWPGYSIDSLKAIYEIRTSREISIERVKELCPHAEHDVETKALTPDLTEEDIAYYQERYLKRMETICQDGYFGMWPARGANKRRPLIQAQYTYPEPPSEPPLEDKRVSKWFTSMDAAVAFIDGLEREYVPEAYQALLWPSVPESQREVRVLRRLAELYPLRVKSFNRKKTRNLTFSSLAKSFKAKNKERA